MLDLGLENECLYWFPPLCSMHVSVSCEGGLQAIPLSSGSVYTALEEKRTAMLVANKQLLAVGETKTMSPSRWTRCGIASAYEVGRRAT